jgi:hypothetical protein
MTTPPFLHGGVEIASQPMYALHASLALAPITSDFVVFKQKKKQKTCMPGI